MHVVVVGSGIIGVTSAYFLRRKGYDVTVIDRQPGVALETSFANAGEVSPGYSAPWPAPGVPFKAMKWLFQEHAPLIIRPRFNRALFRWMTIFLTNCRAENYRANKEKMLILAEYSLSKMNEIRTRYNIEYDEGRGGTLQLFRSTKQLKSSGLDRNILEVMNIPHFLLSAEGCVEREPGLEPVRSSLTGGLWLPGDETGDCFKFANALWRICEQMGVKFSFDSPVHKVNVAGGRVVSLDCGGEELTGDAYLFAAGSFTPSLLSDLKLRLPIYPVKGYSLTADIGDARYAPMSTVLDETYKVAITRLGSRVRVGGLAELCGYDLTLPSARRRTLEHSAGTLFGRACNYGEASFWSGLRPMTPDGPPIIGQTRLENLFLNCGHGTLGWTMSCGSGAMVADIVAGEIPAVSAQAFSVSRFDLN